MRPDLGDVLSTVQRLLQAEISPALEDPFVREQVMYATLLLEYAKKAWPIEHRAIADEHRDLDTTLRALLPHLASLPGDVPAGLLRDVRAHLAASSADRPDAALDAIMERDRGGRQLVDRAVALGTPSSECVAADARERLHTTIDGYLVRSASRQEAAIALLGFAW